MGRRTKRNPWIARTLGVLLLAALVAGGWFWWDVQHWTPGEDAYPDLESKAAALLYLGSNSSGRM